MALKEFYNSNRVIFSSVNSMPQGLVTSKLIKRKCLERLSVLHLLEKTSLIHKEYSHSWKMTVLEEMKEKYPDTYLHCVGCGESFQEMKARHYEKMMIYVVAYSVVSMKLHNLKSWFIRNETRLFTLRFTNMPLEKQRHYMLCNGLACEAVEINYKRTQDIKEVYKVPWEYVELFVSKRQTDLIRGKAYIDVSNLHIVAAAHRKTSLNMFMHQVKIGLPTVILDSRFHELINYLGKVLEIYSNKCNQRLFGLPLNEDEVNLSTLNDLFQSFPPCMQKISKHLNVKHHLRYNGRQQYTPFLRDMGLSVSDALQYFKNHFLQVMETEDYSKKRYDYYIKYTYGLHGSYVGYNCMPCQKIQSTKEYVLADCNGCPFTNATETIELLGAPNNDNLTVKVKKHISSLVDARRPSQACAALFKARHQHYNGDIPEAIVNPVQYYALSRTHYGRTDSNTDSES